MRLKYLILLICTGLSISWSQAAPLKIRGSHSEFKQAMELNRQQNYQKVIRQLADASAYELKIMRAMTLMAQYDEYTTSHSLNQAMTALETLIEDLKSQESQYKENPQFQADSLNYLTFWRAFAQIQLGFANGLKGNGMNSAFLTREGAKALEPLKDNLDAQAFHAMYEYYLGGITSKLPWVEDKREEHLKVIRNAISKSLYFSDLFRTTAIWIHYDRQEYQLGLELAESYLKRYPKHRIFRTIRGDMLRKLKRYQESYEVYQKVTREYHQANTKKGVRALSALGNVVLLKHYLSQLKPDDIQWKDLRTRLPILEDKMPESLLKELQSQDLID